MSPVTEARLLDLLAAAVKAALEVAPDRRGLVAVDFFHRSLSSDERLAFDLFLVRIKDPLAWVAGSPESRWVKRVVRMAELSHHSRACLAEGATQDCPVCVEIRSRMEGGPR